MADDLAGFADEFRWQLTQNRADDSPEAARLRLAGVYVHRLPYQTPRELEPDCRYTVVDTWHTCQIRIPIEPLPRAVARYRIKP